MAATPAGESPAAKSLDAGVHSAQGVFAPTYAEPTEGTMDTGADPGDRDAWRIRPPVPGDVAELVRMRQALWPDADPDEIHGLLESGGPRSCSVRVAERPGGGLAGFVEMATRDYADGCGPGPVGYLEGIWVDPDLRRSGLGAALVEAVLAWASDLGLREMASDTTPENAASRAFHRALGFEEVGHAVLYRRPVPRR